MHKETKYSVLVGLFVFSLAAATVLNGKIASFWGIFAPAGVITFPLSFLITDIISEVWGKKKAKEVVWIGFFTTLLFFVFTLIAINLPSAPFWQGQEAFAQTLAIVGRIAFGGLIAYLISQFHDVWAFHFWKKVTRGKHLWLRNNLSTISSQVLNTSIFVVLVFYGTLPNSALLSTFIGHTTIKIVIALLDTPFCYLGVRWAKNESKL